FNLAGNAIKFTNNEDGRKGRVIVRADRVDDGSTDTATVRYEVQDNGIGISEEGRARLFQAFSQAEESTTRRFGGTGLGLAICSRLATMMGGEIGCDSVEGEGSTFHFQVTYRPADDTRTGRDVSVLQDLSGLRILLAEADDNRRAFLHRYLTHWRAEVVDAEDEAAFSALSDAAAGAPFDIVVLGTGWDMDGKRDIRDGLRDRPGFTEARYVLLKRGRSVFEQIDGDDTVVFGATPLTRSGFIRAVAIAAGRASPEIQHQEETETMERVTAPTVEEAEAQGRLILLAEDNEINQKVITRQLDLLGYAALVANDGQEALETWRSRRFGMVLTDCHMPEMDGYELTRSIRAEETDGRIPILAITANALQGESDRCLSVGMDDYLSKPVELAKLKTMLAKWMPAAGAAPAAAPAPEPVAAGMAPIDPKALTALVGDDPEMCRQLLADFVEPSWRYIGEVKEGVRSASAISVAQAAHKLKSSSRAVGANELADLCLQLEAAGKAGDWEGIGAAAPRLDGLMQDVEAYVARQ
ncbi:MAG: response regulator, partial [Rhodobacterales bacterium]|nr:response regulator [Rhodobacterales bacterium]